MTLVVAQKKGICISLVSDTGVTSNGVQLGLEHHLPKVCILNSQLAVGFAGASELAVQAIAAFPREVSPTYHAVTQHFLNSHRTDNVDYIIGFGAPLFKLAKISNNEVRQNRTFEWIGDQAGFENYQRFRTERVDPAVPHFSTMISSTRPSERGTPTFDMVGCVRDVILGRRVHSVFGHPVAISNADGAFELRSYAITLEEKSLAMPDGAALDTFLRQLSEARAYSFSCFVGSTGDTTNAVAFHYMRGKVTYVYYGQPGHALTGYKSFTGLNIVEMGETTRAEYGISWIGAIGSRTGVPADYGIPASAWRTQKSAAR
ncbi:hypothetical protein [Bradyrhizobium sp.]|uniref:hypothetical protein n=1 Tax=Bradyrhizobium sp. TaxID=376 RepID=UPI0039E4E6F9